MVNKDKYNSAHVFFSNLSNANAMQRHARGILDHNPTPLMCVSLAQNVHYMYTLNLPIVAHSVAVCPILKRIYSNGFRTRPRMLLFIEMFSFCAALKTR